MTTTTFYIGLNIPKVPAFRGRLSFSSCILKNFQIFLALLVNFKKDPWVDFFAEVSPISPVVTDDWIYRT
jgi:hypothetical protein